VLLDSGEDDSPSIPSLGSGTIYQPGATTVYLWHYGVVPGCYGVIYDSASKIKAEGVWDACELEILSTVDCAPGWSEGYLLSRACDLFTACIDRAEKAHEKELKEFQDLQDLGAVQADFTYNYSAYDSVTLVDAWVLPTGWDNINAVKSIAKDSVNEEIALDFSSYRLYPTNLTLLIIGVVGWVFLIVGIVLGFLGGGETAE
jgi:hypothetical protein